MKILLVTIDNNAWAVTFRARSLAKEFLKKGHIIAIKDRHSIKSDFDNWVKDYDIIQFLFSGGLTEFSEQFKKYPNKFFTSIVSHRSIEGMWDDKKKLIEVYENSAGIIALSNRLNAAISPRVKTPVIYIPNGVDVKLFKPEYSFTVGFVGRRDKYKGYHLIKEACENLGINFIHDGNEYPKAVTPHNQMPEIYKKFDCLVIASEGEGCHNPTLEALAMNIPVISTDIGIARDLDGVILVHRDVGSIMEGIRKVYGRKQMMDNFTWDIIASKYLRVYNQFLKGKLC